MLLQHFILFVTGISVNKGEKQEKQKTETKPEAYIKKLVNLFSWKSGEYFIFSPTRTYAFPITTSKKNLLYVCACMEFVQIYFRYLFCCTFYILLK